MAIHIFNPPEPHGNRVRAPASNTNTPAATWRCGSCHCVPTAWKLTVPAAGRLVSTRVGDFLLRRRDPRQAAQCAWEAEASDLTLGGPLWRLRWGRPFNNAAINGDWWIVESGETDVDGPLFQFLHEGEGDAANDYTWNCLGPNTLAFTLQDGESEAAGDPVSVTVEPFWK